MLQNVDEVGDIGSVFVRFVVGEDPFFLVIFSFYFVVCGLLQPLLEFLQGQPRKDHVFDHLLVHLGYF